MASNDTNMPIGHRGSPDHDPRGASASTWYLVTGAAVLLTVLYLLTTGMMRSPADDFLPATGTLSAPPVSGP